MNHGGGVSTAKQGLLSALAIALTLAFSIVSVRHLTRPRPLVRAEPATAARRAPLGVVARITAGEITVERTLPLASFSIEPGQSLDRRIPPGPFEVALQVTLLPGQVEYARVGARLQNASLIVMKDGDPVLSTFAAETSSVKLTTQPIFVGGRRRTLTFIVRHDGAQPTRFRAMWQPEASAIALPLPSKGAALVDEPSLRGQLIVQESGCANCHQSGDATLQAWLTIQGAPELGAIGRRARPEWIRSWVRDPVSMKPSTIMPALFDGSAEDEAAIEDLTHFLVSLGGPIDVATESAPSPTLVRAGRRAYHEVGCFACHGALEPLAALSGTDVTARREPSPFGHLGQKTTARELAAFLLDPHAARPRGRMPAMDLSEAEAEAIAAYLIEREPVEQGASAFTIDPNRVARGRGVFAARGCAACHELGSNHPAIASTLSASTLEAIAGAADRGCLSDEPAVPAAQYAFSSGERGAVQSMLEGLGERRAADVPVDRLAATLARLDCLACHAYGSAGGPEPSRRRYFVTVGEADLGDEGRLPPALDGVGAKLTPAWLDRVLVGDGRVRRYMGARMPVYGAAVVGDSPAWLTSAAGADPEVIDEPTFDVDLAAIGRTLTGDAAFNCIQCHEIAGHPSTGTHGPDLAGMTERLRFESFDRWLHDPSQVRPGTRMPSFFHGGRSGFIDYLDGRADEQIRALWSYLSQGEHLPLPDGLVDPAGLELAVTDEPVIFRTFMRDAGVRAIACGFPVQIHAAFDADACRLALVWEGPFLNAAGAWAARGGSETNPDAVIWTAPPGPFIRSGDADAGAVRFGGYALDERRRPVFEYTIGRGDAAVTVTEQLDADRLDGARLVRRLRLRGAPGQRLMLAREGQTVALAAGRLEDENATTVTLALDQAGLAEVVMEVRW